MAFQFAEGEDCAPELQVQSESEAAARDFSGTNSRNDYSRGHLDSSEIGIDIMRVALPTPVSESLEQDLEDSIESVSEAVSLFCFHQLRSSSIRGLGNFCFSRVF